MDNRLIEHAGPEQPRYFTPITVIKLAYTRKSGVPLFPENEDPEVQVWLRIGEDEKSIVVPSRVIDDERGIIIGTMRTYLQSANRVTIGFPRTNWKTARISADREDLIAIAQPFDDGAYTRVITDDRTAAKNI